MSDRFRQSLLSCVLVLGMSGVISAQEQILSSPDTRLTMGLEQSGASSGTRNTTFLLDFMLTAPLAPLRGPDKPGARRYPWVQAWMNARLSGVPQQNNTAVKQFIGGFESGLIDGKASDLLQGVSLVGGAEFNVFGNGIDFTDGHLQKFHPTFIVGTGFTSTPAPHDVLPTFELTDEARERFGVPADSEAHKYKHIAFAQPERDTFFGQWYAGVRLKTHHYDSTTASSESRFPGIIDLTFGQNAAVSGGELGAGLELLRLEAFYPLPTEKKGLKAIYFFGTVFKHLERGRESNAIILKGSKVEVPSPEVYVHTLSSSERRRDFWSFGVGVDLIALIPKAAATQR
jgi:hypothetical protein